MYNRTKKPDEKYYEDTQHMIFSSHASFSLQTKKGIYLQIRKGKNILICDQSFKKSMGEYVEYLLAWYI